jgi:hypothetical protein
MGEGSKLSRRTILEKRNSPHGSAFWQIAGRPWHTSRDNRGRPAIGLSRARKLCPNDAI